MLIAVVGLGFVGSAVFKSFQLKGLEVVGYDKFKNSDTFESCLKADIMFLCLPTLFSEELNQYDLSSVHEVCGKLCTSEYQGCVVLKSTVEPETTKKLSEKYNNLSFVHNPEFLTARTAFEDFHNQKHIILGSTTSTKQQHIEKLCSLCRQCYPDAKISLCHGYEIIG